MYIKRKHIKLIDWRKLLFAAVMIWSCCAFDAYCDKLNISAELENIQASKKADDSSHSYNVLDFCAWNNLSTTKNSNSISYTKLDCKLVHRLSKQMNFTSQQLNESTTVAYAELRKSYSQRAKHKHPRLYSMHYQNYDDDAELLA